MLNATVYWCNPIIKPKQVECRCFCDPRYFTLNVSKGYFKGKLPHWDLFHFEVIVNIDNIIFALLRSKFHLSEDPRCSNQCCLFVFKFSPNPFRCEWEEPLDLLGTGELLCV